MSAVRTGLMTLRKVVDSYLLSCQTEGKSSHTLRWYEQKLGTFVEWAGEREGDARLSHLDLGHVRAFLLERQALGRTAFTTRGYAQVLKGFGTWLAEEGYVAQSPLLRLTLPKVPRYVVKPLTPADVASLLLAVKPRSARGARDLAILLLLLDTGMRLGELVSMTTVEADEAVRGGFFRVMGKGARERYLPLGKATRDALRRYVDVYRPPALTEALLLGSGGRPIRAEGVRQVVRRVARRAGIAGVHPHRLRHTFAVNYIANGGDAMTLQRILGHSTLEMVRRYVALDPREIMLRHSQVSPGDRFWASRGLRRSA